MVNLTELQGSLNKEELEALKKAKQEKKLQKIENLKKLFDKKTLNKLIGMTEEDKGKTKNDGVISFEELKKQQGKKVKIMEAAKGGEVKGYMGGGEVHMDDSPSSGMITQRGWGASRKT